MPSQAQSDEFAPFRPLFEHLTSDDEKIRLEASRAILVGLEDAAPVIIKRALDRLLAGLTSGRKSARIGFSVTLTELLSRLYSPHPGRDWRTDLPVPDLVQLLRTSTEPKGGLGGQEIKDHYLGRLFGLKAILDSRLLFHGDTSRKDWILVLDMVFELASKKSWLREECGWIIHRLVKDCHLRPSTKELAETVIERLCAHKMALTPEGVAIWMTVQDLHVDVTLPKRPWQHQDPLHSSNLDQLAGVMRDAPMGENAATEESQSGPPSRGVWNARPNIAWMMVLDKYYQGERQRRPVKFSRFWTRAVDENLFTATASPERKHLGFMLMASGIEKAPSDFLPELFTRNVVRCLANHVSNAERYLHRAAMKCLQEMLARAERQPGTAYEFLTGLTMGGVLASFDQMTKTKLLRSMLATEPEWHHLVMIERWDGRLTSLAMKDAHEEADVEARAVVDSLVAFLRLHDRHDQTTCTSNILGVLAAHLYTANDRPKDPNHNSLSPTTRKYLASKLSSSYAYLMSVGASSSSSEIWPAEALKYLESPEVIRHRSWNKELDRRKIKKVVAGFWKRSQRLRQAVSQGDQTRARYLRALEWLYSLLIFEMYNANEDALPVLSDVKVICDKTLEDDGEDTSAVLTELLLMLVSKPSALLRKLAQQVFGAFTSDLTADSLQLLYDVLASPESLTGQQQVFDQDSDIEEVQPQMTHEPQSRKRKREDSNEADDASEEPAFSAEEHIGNDDDDDDEAMPDADSKSAPSDAEDGNASDLDDDNDADDDDGDELARFNTALASIVGTKPFDPAVNESDNTNSDADTASQTSSAMFALDEQLAQVFRERQKHHQPSKTQRQSQKDARSNMIQFKNRVLDLLDVYLKQENTNALAITPLIPLLQLMRTTRTKQLADRAATILRNFSQKCKGRDNVPRLPTSKPRAIVFQKDGLDLLKKVHEEAGQTGTPKAHAAGCSQASILLVKALVYRTNTPEGEMKMIKEVVKIYAATQMRWLLDRGRGRQGAGGGGIQAGFFTDFVNWGQSFNQQPQRQST